MCSTGRSLLQLGIPGMDTQQMLDIAVYCSDIVSVSDAQERASITEVSTFRTRFIFNGTCNVLLQIAAATALQVTGRMRSYFKQWKTFVHRRERVRRVVVRLISRAELLSNPTFVAWQRWREATVQQRALVLRTFYCWRQNVQERNLMRGVISRALFRHEASAMRVAWDRWCTVSQEAKLAQVCPAMGTAARKRRLFTRWRQHCRLSTRISGLERIRRKLLLGPALAAWGRATIRTAQHGVFASHMLGSGVAPAAEHHRHSMGRSFTPLAPAFEFPWQREQRVRYSTLGSGREYLEGNGGASLVACRLPVRSLYTYTAPPPLPPSSAVASCAPGWEGARGKHTSYRAACAASAELHAGFVGTSLHRCVERWVLREALWGWRLATRTEEEHRTQILRV